LNYRVMAALEAATQSARVCAPNKPLCAAAAALLGGRVKPGHDAMSR
jgi:hypothetical protein